MAARDDDKAMDGLLKRSLARDTGAAGECPDADILAAYYERSLEAEEAAGYERHIARCARCREHLASILRAESAVEVSAEENLVAAAASAPRAMAASPVVTAATKQPSRSWVFDWRWLAPAAAVVIFAVVVYVRMSPPIGISSHAPNNVAVLKHEAPAQPGLLDNRSAPEAQSKEQQSARATPPAPQVNSAAPVSSPHENRRAGAASDSSEKKTAPPQSQRTQTVGGAIASRNAAAASTATPKQAAAGAQSAPRNAASGAPAAPQAYQQAESSERPAVASAAGAMSGVAKPAPAAAGGATGGVAGTAAPPPAPPPAKARKDAKAADSSAPSAQANAANEKSKAPEEVGGRAEDRVSAVTQTVEVTSSAVMLSRTAQVARQYRVTPDGLVERSTDGGATWHLERLKTSAPIIAASSPSGNICWVVGRGGTILLTKNGKSWKKISPPVEIDLLGVTARDERSATVTAIDGRKYSTADGGKTWEQMKE